MIIIANDAQERAYVLRASIRQSISAENQLLSIGTPPILPDDKARRQGCLGHCLLNTPF